MCVCFMRVCVCHMCFMAAVSARKGKQYLHSRAHPAVLLLIIQLQARYCSARCRQAAGSTSSSMAHTPSSASGSSKAAAAPTACCAEHMKGGLECGKPWTRLLPEEAVLASRCLSAAAAAKAAAAAATSADTNNSSAGSCGGGDNSRTQAASHAQQQQQLPPQQWQQLCEQQKQLHTEVLRASLLDSLAHHTSTRQDDGDAEQLTLACVVSCLHAAAAASKPSVVPSPPPLQPQAVLQCLQQLVANGIAIKPFLSSGPDDRLGFGLYPVTAAVLNHDCNPNCSIRYESFVTRP